MPCGCISVETPQSILDKEQIDVFTVILDDAPDEFVPGMRNALWSRFRFRGIGSGDRVYWIQCMKDRYGAIANRYHEAFEVYRKYQEQDFTDLSAGSSELQYIHEDTPDTAIGTESSFMASRDTTKSKTYSDLPQTTLKQALQDLKDPYSMFASEFDSYFLMIL